MLNLNPELLGVKGSRSSFLKLIGVIFIFLLLFEICCYCYLGVFKLSNFEGDSIATEFYIISFISFIISCSFF